MSSFGDFLKQMLNPEIVFDVSEESLTEQHSIIMRNTKSVAEELHKLDDISLISYYRHLTKPTDCGNLYCMLSYSSLMLTLNNEIYRRMRAQKAKEDQQEKPQ